VRGPQLLEGEALGFHWDRDEYFADHNAGRNLHPLIASVTYLSDYGAPTMVLAQTPLSLPADKTSATYRGGSTMHNNGGNSQRNKNGNHQSVTIERGALSHPRFGKHLAFSGDFLHGVPSDLQRLPLERMFPERITFLVNMWLDHVPSDTLPFPTDGLAFRSMDQRARAAASEGLEAATCQLDPAREVRLQSVCAGARSPQLGWTFGRPGEDYSLFCPIPEQALGNDPRGTRRRTYPHAGSGKGNIQQRNELFNSLGQIDEETMEITFSPGAKLQLRAQKHQSKNQKNTYSKKHY
jgi:hypothetical protein